MIAENMFNRRARDRSTSFLLGGALFFMIVFFSFALMIGQNQSLSKMKNKLSFLKQLKNI